MPDDLRALLAAIVADPADDTARLVYADCLQEHGNTPRADFIRFQIEAERLHPDSNTRARLEQFYQDNQALELTEIPGGGTLVTVRLPYRVRPRSEALAP